MRSVIGVRAGSGRVHEENGETEAHHEKSSDVSGATGSRNAHSKLCDADDKF